MIFVVGISDVEHDAWVYMRCINGWLGSVASVTGRKAYDILMRSNDGGYIISRQHYVN